MRPRSRRYRRRRARLTVATAAAAVLLCGGAALTFGLRDGAAPRMLAGNPSWHDATPSTPADRTTAADPSIAGGATVASTPQTGTWKYASGQGRILGTVGPVRRYRVAVESKVNIDADDFAQAVDTALGDGRSWIAGGEFRLQRVPENAAADFTIYLATPQTSTRMCQAGGLDTGGYTSCRTPGHVIINLDRWTTSVPDYRKAGIPLDTYRTYVINHESGHEFGHGHELCPGAGQPAPVMEQQTLGLHGCTANPWPYVDGKRYAGPPGQYDRG